LAVLTGVLRESHAAQALFEFQFSTRKKATYR